MLCPMFWIFCVISKSFEGKKISLYESHAMAQILSNWELTLLSNLEKAIRLLYGDRNSYYSK